MELFLQSFIDDWQNFVAYAPRILLSILILLVTYIIGKFLSKVVIKMLKKTSLSEIHEPFFRVTTILLALLIGSIFVLQILGLERLATSILAGGGITAIILGFAFREIGENFLAGFFLAFSRPFNIGDIIKTEDDVGKVKDIAIRYTHLRTDDGLDIYVPSSQLFNKTVTNFTRDKIRRFSFTIGIDYQNDAGQACELLKTCIREPEGVLDNPAPTAYISALTSQYVELEVFYWVVISEMARSPLDVRTDLANRCRMALLDGGYTVSSETTSNIAIMKGETNTP